MASSECRSGGVVIETNARTRILIDTPPELRMQLLRAASPRVDAVLYTHEHADHVAGIDDLWSRECDPSATLAGACPPVYSMLRSPR